MHSSKSNPKPKAEPPARERRFVFEALGTRWTVDIYEPLPEAAARSLLAGIRRRLAAFDKNYSRFREDSLVSRMARTPGTYMLPRDARPLLDIYQQLYELTDGAMTPLIGRLLSDAGYDAQYSLKPKPKLQAPPAWGDMLAYSFPHLTLKQPALLDFGAAGKGYAVDIIAGLLARRGLREFCVDAGGDMFCRLASLPPLRVGLEHPGKPGEVVGVARVGSGQSLCGSAGNRRAWGTFHHIMDPHSQRPVQQVRAVWVVAGSTLVGDALTTALFFVPPAVLARQFAFEYALVRDDFSLAHSPQFPAEFFTAEGPRA